MKKTVAAAILLFMVFGGFANAQKMPEIRLAVTAGMGRELRELFIKVYEEAGIPVKLCELPTARVMSEFDAGTVDAVLFASDAAVKTRPQAFMLGFGSEPLFTFNVYGHVLAFRLDEFLKSRDYSRFSIAYITGNQAHENAILAEKAKAVPVPDYGNAVNMLVSRRIDMILAVPGALTDYLVLNKIEPDAVSMLPAPIATFRYFHIINAKFKKLVPVLEQALQKNKAVIKTLFGG